MDINDFQRWMGRIEQKLDDLTKKVDNHLNHHFRFTLFLAGGFITVIIFLLEVILKIK